MQALRPSLDKKTKSPKQIKLIILIGSRNIKVLWDKLKDKGQIQEIVMINLMKYKVLSRESVCLNKKISIWKN